MMKKIKIITFSRVHNYGAELQTYALQKFLLKKYTDVQIIDYRNKVVLAPYKVFSINKKNLKTIIKSLVKNVLFHNRIKKRFYNFTNYENKKINFTSRKYYNSQELSEIKSDIFITGSDQVWNRKITDELSDEFTLNFKIKKGKKISYAASVGDVTQIDKYKNEYIKKISQLDNISVREEDAKWKLARIINKEIQSVLDPTLLLTTSDWNAEIENHKNNNEKYILAYVVSPDEEYIKIVNNISKKTGLKVIHFELTNPGYKNVYKSYYTDGPLEFIKLIKNAEYIVATSFHATVFSIIFNKKFWIVPHKTTGSRVTDLLKKLGISNRAVNTIDEFNNKDYNEEIDYEKVNKLLEKERQKSIDWLMDAIEK